MRVASKRAVHMTPEIEKSIVAMRKAGVIHGQIAVELGISVSAVQKRLMHLGFGTPRGARGPLIGNRR